MPSGPKKRAKAKKKQQAPRNPASVLDESDSQSQASDDRETDTCESVEEQEEEVAAALKSPLGKAACSAAEEEVSKAQTEEWVTLTNFDVGLPTPRQDNSPWKPDFDQLAEEENGSRSPKWETVESERGASACQDESGEGKIQGTHLGVRFQEVQALLYSASAACYSSPDRRSQVSEAGDQNEASVLAVTADESSASIESAVVVGKEAAAEEEGKVKNLADLTETVEEVVQASPSRNLDDQPAVVEEQSSVPPPSFQKQVAVSAELEKLEKQQAQVKVEPKQGINRDHIANGSLAMDSKLQALQSVDMVTAAAAGESNLQASNRGIVVDQLKDVRDGNRTGCCALFSWIFSPGQ